MNVKLAASVLLTGLMCVTASNPLALRASEPGSLDDKLLDDSPERLGGGVDADLFREGPEAAPPSPGAAEESLESRLERELGHAATSEGAHPLLAIARQMRDVQTRLARQAADGQTTALQEQIVAQLDMLLEEARQQAAASAEGARQAPPAAEQQADAQPGDETGGDGDPQQAPAREATDEPGEAETVEERPERRRTMQAMEALWNRLPERQREQLLQLAPEQFLPKYELQIEQYFRRLAEE